ncbi:MAG: hypothetical protein O9267_10350 [Flavobacterium sp.]|uniref:hypothetical protein n=1 Tax=Flavobacterium sp. TaxID=239 RepID=UPI0022BDAD31|nr:hypothetical protein [Flavobacterium sp.]MCZ8197997.1 hypothetical protein [Flavobacterium sp.]
MGNRKDIGTILKEKINRLDKSPNENGWNAIQTELDKKKSKKVFLLYWLSSLLIISLGILITSKLLLNQPKNNDTIHLENRLNKIKENRNNTNNKSKDSNQIKIEAKSKHTNLTNEASEKIEENNKINITTKNNKVSKTTLNNSNPVNEKHAYNKKSTSNKRISALKSKEDKSTFKSKKIGSVSKRKLKKKKSSSILEKNNFGTNIFQNDSSSKNSEKGNTKFSTSSSNENKDSNVIIKDKLISDEKLSIQKTGNKLEKEKLNQISKDSIKKKNEALKTKKDSVSKIIEKERYVTVFIYGTPTFYKPLNENFILDNSLKNNPTTSKTQLSYGAYLCFQGTDNLSIRLGYGKNNIKYSTQNVTINTSNFSNIDYDSGVSNQFIYSQSNNSKSMSVFQELSYTDIPFEIKYKILKKKVGFNAIFGVNFLLLEKNEVSIVTENGLKYKIGKTGNLLKQSFGANIGLGLDYKISKRIKINVEPMIKYHFKDIENRKSDSYIFNILTGIEFDLFKTN